MQEDFRHDSVVIFSTDTYIISYNIILYNENSWDVLICQIDSCSGSPDIRGNVGAHIASLCLNDGQGCEGASTMGLLSVPIESNWHIATLCSMLFTSLHHLHRVSMCEQFLCGEMRRDFLYHSVHLVSQSVWWHFPMPRSSLLLAREAGNASKKRHLPMDSLGH